MKREGAALSLPGVELKRLAFVGSALLHAALALTILLMANPGLRRPPQQPRSIDLVSVEQLLPPPPAPPTPTPSEAAPLASSPPPAAAPPTAAPASAAAPQSPASPGPAGPDLPDSGPATSGGMTAQAGAGGGGRAAPAAAGADDGEYLPQFKITEAPVIPIRAILAKIEYPPLAARQGIEATVFLELLIDSAGTIRKVNVLKDPGYGFAEVAVAALLGTVCSPAKVDGRAVPVRIRYPVRFTLK